MCLRHEDSQSALPFTTRHHLCIVLLFLFDLLSFFIR